MKINGFTDLTRASVSQRLTSLSRFRTFAILLVVLVVLLVGPGVAISSTIPTITITDVIANQEVFIQTHNYPAGQNFVVTMGPYGSYGINGIKVGEFYSENGGSMSKSFPIPSAFHGAQRIAIRLESPQGYYSYNWFWNNSTIPPTSASTSSPSNVGIGGPTTPGYTGIPTIGISSVVKDNKIVVHTHNFPAGQEFRWTMGPMGTRGINGYVVLDKWPSGDGGYTSVELTIPPALYGSSQISVRAQTAHPWPYPYYAFNWFWNNDANANVTDPHAPTDPHSTVGQGAVQPTTSTNTQPYYYSGIPTFTVCIVDRDNTVSIRTHNFPPNQTFRVTMGPMWTAGINGYEVGFIDSGDGTSELETFPIPSQLYGHTQISIRAQTGHQYPYIPYYAYNWFWNNDAKVCE